MQTNRKEIKLYKAKSILDVTEKDSLYCLKADNETEFRIIVTDAFGNPVNLKDLTGGTITNVINTDGSITVTGSSVKDIKLSSTLYNLISSALQAGDNISSLTNNAGFITLGDIPSFNPLDYDLTDFTNSDVDPFARLSDIVSGSGIQSVVAGTNITVDNTDPLNPTISALVPTATSDLANDGADGINPFITIGDIPAFNPLDYDLDDFNNLSGDPFARQSDLSSGSTNLGYTPSPTNGIVTSDTGTDSTIPLADNTNAGLLSPSEKSDIASAVQPGDLATVATSGDYNDLINTPTEGFIVHTTASGTDTYTATVTGVTSYSDGDAYLVRFTNGNTTGCTLNINSLGAKVLYRNNDGVLIGGDIVDGGEMLCVYNTTLNGFQCIGTAPNTLLAYVTNADSVAITKGQPVYAFSGTGDRMTVKRALNTSDATSAQTVGLVLSTSIAAGQKGVIMMQGLLDGLSILPTSTFADGDPIYLGATAGTITNVKPYAPNHLVYLGVVTTASNGSAGRMYVRVQNGYELDELHNVQAKTPTFKDTLWYDNTVSPAQWKTASLATILGYTPANDSNVVHLTGNETIAGDKDFTSRVQAEGGFWYTVSGVYKGQIISISDDTFYNANSGRTHYFGMGNGVGVANNPNNLVIANGNLGVLGQTVDTIASFDTNKNIVSLPLATYPSLTELARVKGVTSPIQPQIDTINVNVITITTSVSITTDTTGSGYGQHGRHVKISNGANAINLTVQTTSNADFVASYEKIGSSTITFVAGSGATLVLLSGTAALSGVVGSKACLSRNGNTYYLQITNY